MSLGAVDHATTVTSDTPALYRPYGSNLSSGSYGFPQSNTSVSQSVFATAPFRSRLASGNSQLAFELLERFKLLSGLANGWDGPKSVSPTLGALMGMLSLGNSIVESNQFLPHALNITPAATGEICFTLFGRDGREAEIWVGDQPGMISFVLSDDGNDIWEGRMPSSEYRELAMWLDSGDKSGFVDHLNDSP